MTPREIPYAELAAGAQLAAYSSPPQIANWAKSHDLPNVKFYEVGGTFAFVAWSSKLAVVAFQGTNEFLDWFKNADCRKFELGGGAYCHKGFHDYMKAVGRDMRDHLRENCQGVPLVVTGHSLGAAAAQLFVVDFMQWRGNILREEVYIHLFGSPRALSAKAAKMFGPGSLFPNCWNWINNADIIPRIIPALPNWLRWLKRVKIGGLRRVRAIQLFDVCGRFVPNPSKCRLIHDFIAGIWQDVGVWGLAGAKDHSADDYYRLVAK